MFSRAFLLGFLLTCSALLAACSDAFLERVQTTSDNLDSWFAERGISDSPSAASGSGSAGSAAGGSTGATANTGVPAAAEAAYQEGLALKRDGAPDRAVERFQVAADAGHPAAAYELAEAYWHGNGVARDDQIATQWLNTAADRGEPRAQYLLGAAYYGGLGVEQDDAIALHWLGQAATAGLDRAQFLLAEAFANGRGVEADPAWAARWYGKAARQGHSRAQLAYGLMQARGRGLPADPVQGYAWLTIAARNGQAEAETARQGVARRLSPEQLAAAEAEAERFRPRANSRFADPPTVMYVQYRLSRLGFAVGGIDGLLGPQTRTGIYQYQRARGRPIDGQLTPELLIALLQEPKA